MPKGSKERERKRERERERDQLDCGRNNGNSLQYFFLK